MGNLSTDISTKFDLTEAEREIVESEYKKNEKQFVPYNYYLNEKRSYGFFGAHHFYLGNVTRGLSILGLKLCLYTTTILWLFSIIDGDKLLSAINEVVFSDKTEFIVKTVTTGLSKTDNKTINLVGDRVVGFVETLNDPKYKETIYLFYKGIFAAFERIIIYFQSVALYIKINLNLSSFSFTIVAFSATALVWGISKFMSTQDSNLSWFYIRRANHEYERRLVNAVKWVNRDLTEDQRRAIRNDVDYSLAKQLKKLEELNKKDEELHNENI